MTRLSYVGVLVGVGLLAACGDDDGPAAADAAASIDVVTLDANTTDAIPSDAGNAGIPEDPPLPLPTGDPSVKFITFNTALLDANIVKAPVERRPIIVAALKGADADVLCLQENFNQYGGPDALAAELADTYPYSFWTWAATGAHPLGNGLLIASKYPIYRGREHLFTAQNGIVDRAIIGVDVLMPDSYFHLMCTHLQAGLDTGNPQASVEVRTAEIQEVFTWAQAEGYMDGPTFWLGDFNAGPDPVGACGGGADPEDCCSPTDPLGNCTSVADVTNYNLIDTMFDNAATDALGCTSCRGMFIPLQVLNTFNNEPSQRIDHCWSRNVGNATVVQDVSLVFTQDIALPYSGPGAPVGGETLHTMSDHFGVRCHYIQD